MGSVFFCKNDTEEICMDQVIQTFKCGLACIKATL